MRLALERPLAGVTRPPQATGRAAGLPLLGSRKLLCAFLGGAYQEAPSQLFFRALEHRAQDARTIRPSRTVFCTWKNIVAMALGNRSGSLPSPKTVSESPPSGRERSGVGVGGSQPAVAQAGHSPKAGF